MKNFKKAGVIILTTLLLSCTEYKMICSLNPFFLEKYVVLIPEMEGSWIANTLQSSGWNTLDMTSVWKIERVITSENIKTENGQDSISYQPQKKYLIKLTSGYPDSFSYTFQMVLFKIKNNLYGDFRPVNNTAFEKSKFAHESNFKFQFLIRLLNQLILLRECLMPGDNS